MHAPSVSRTAPHIYFLSWSYILTMRERDVCTLGNVSNGWPQKPSRSEVLSRAFGASQLIHSIDFALPLHLARPVLAVSRRAQCGRDAVYGLGPT